MIKRMDALRWTSQMDECIRVLSEHPESFLDTVFVAQVRLQMVMEQVNQADWQPNAGTFTGPGHSTSLTRLYINALRSKIEEVMMTIPQELQEHGTPFSPNRWRGVKFSSD